MGERAYGEYPAKDKLEYNSNYSTQSVMKYIECMGIPGSGKTTVARDVVGILGPKHHTVLTRWDVKPRLMQAMLRKRAAFGWRLLSWCLSWQKSPFSTFLWARVRYNFMLRFIRYNSSLIPHVVENAERFPSSPGVAGRVLSSEKLISWFFDVACIYQAAQDILENHAVLLMEEGFCQQTYYLISAFRDDDRIQFLKNYIRAIPKPDLVIALSAEPEKCEHRLQTRATGIPSKILHALTPPERIALFEHRLNTYQRVAQYLEEHDVPVLRVDNNNNYSSTRKILEQALARF